MQAAQNTSQVFLGVNLKCTSCHDSFVNKWKLKDAYGLAAYFSPDGTLQMFRCDLPQDKHTGPGFIFPGFARSPRSDSLADRRAAAAAMFTDPRLGRLPRTLVNRVWQRLLGRGIVGTVDEMDGEPWSPALLDWLAADFVAHQYDIKHLIETIVTSRAYQMPAVRREAEAAPAATSSADPRCGASPPSSSPTPSDRSPASGAWRRWRRHGRRMAPSPIRRRRRPRCRRRPASRRASGARPRRR